MISVLGLYFFALAGFILKKIFPDQLSAKALGITTVYFFQPLLVLWGFTSASLDWSILHVGILHFLTGIFVSFPLLFLLFKIIPDTKAQALICFTGTSGNTGNIGIPLAGIFFGPIGILAATMINVWNVFWSFIVGVFFYARGNFSIAKSLLEIFKMPLVWASLIGIVCNAFGIIFPEKIAYFLEIGAHTSIATQLLLLGIFIAGIQFTKFDIKMSMIIALVKFLIFPLVGIVLLFAYQYFFGSLPFALFWVGVIQLIVPLATSNGNLATLYHCYPEKVSESILFSYGIFLGMVPILFFFFI